MQRANKTWALFNPFVDLPVTLTRVFYTLISAIWYLPQLFSVTVLGILLFKVGKKTDKKRYFYHWYIHVLYRLNLKIMPGVKSRIDNQSGENFQKGAVAICNHQSFLDSVFMFILTPKILIVTNDHVWSNKLIHLVLGFVDFYPISRGIENSISFFQRYIDKGYLVVIFPEGERSLSCSILRFHQGAFLLANRLKCDILPLFLHGAGHVMPKGCNWVNRGSVTVKIGKRIKAEDISIFGENISACTKKFRHYYQMEYADICRSIENFAYYKDFLINIYRRVGIFPYLKVKRYLKRNMSIPAIVDTPCDKHLIIILNDYFGVIGLAFALTHHEKQIITSDEAHYLQSLMQKCKNLPKNIELLQDVDRNAICTDEVQLVLVGPSPADYSFYEKYNPLIVKI